ncbi:MAG: LD-carboxypeptidase [Candidatus Dojkabacteria bacterium]|jgi:muramoyltetrapeptide carboxypeptidase LdcA involved in peptidoglycan recycling|nr:LD-carboxypeptidase [Candidatus Dojkabacteria bacterium]
MEFKSLVKLKRGDKVAVLSPSFAAPGKWPDVYQLGLERLRKNFGLEPVEFPTTKEIGSTGEDRAKDLVKAFENSEIKAVIASLGGDDQVTYIKNLPREPFINNPKPFFGYSDNTHFINHLWLCGIPSYYGGHLFTEFAMQGGMDDLTIKYLKYALFEDGEFELEQSDTFNDIGLSWNDPKLLNQRRRYQENEGWYWDGKESTEGVLWGGCVESLDELLRHNIAIPSVEDFQNVVLFMETSEEIPSSDYVRRVIRAFGERGILKNIKGIFFGRPKAWEFDKQYTDEEKIEYKKQQREMVLEIVRRYNEHIPIIQNMDFGHTSPQICLSSGNKVRIDSVLKKVYAQF